MTWVAVGAAVVAGAGTYYNSKQVAKKQDNQLASSLREQQQLQQQANQKTGQLIQKTADSTVEPAKSSLLQSYMQQLQAKNAAADAPLSQAGDVSDAYTKAANNAALGVSQYGDTRANLISAIDAPAVQRQGEAADLMRYGTDVGQIKQQSAADQFLTQMKLRSIAPNPWIQAVSNAAGVYARSGAANANGYSPSSDADFSQGLTTTGTGGFTYNLPNR